MPKAEKVATVAEITDRFRNSAAAVVTEYRGLTMAQLTELRRSLGKGAEYTVAKNTLVKRAAADAGVVGLDEMFIGPTAVAFVRGEPVDAAKALRDFAKAHPLLIIKGGLLDGRAIEAGEVNKLADLDSREVLLGKMAGAMLATLTKAAIVLNALPSQVVRLAAALQEKRMADGETLDAPVTDGVPAEAAAPEEAVSAQAPAEGADNAQAADESGTPEAVSAQAPAEGADNAQAADESGTPEAVSAQAPAKGADNAAVSSETGSSETSTEETAPEA